MIAIGDRRQRCRKAKAAVRKSCTTRRSIPRPWANEVIVDRRSKIHIAERGPGRATLSSIPPPEIERSPIVAA